jgi:hypothetical protein
MLERARRLGPLPYSALGAVDVGPGPPAGPPARWVAAMVDRCWEEQGRPDPFTVVELGAGDGSRARDVLGLGPECLTALRYIVVEAGDPTVRLSAHGSSLPVEDPAYLFPAAGADPEDPDEVAPPARGVGPLVTSLGDLPVVPGPAVILALGWLNRLPSDRVEWRRRWWEVRLAAAGDEPVLSEVLVPLEPRRMDAIGELVAGEPPEGARFALLVGADAWMASALGSAASGSLVVVDRWTNRTEPLHDADPPALSLDQLRRHREPLDPEPVPVCGSLASVSWRVG